MATRARCEKCDRDFKDVDGLKAHNHAKHFNEVEPVKRSAVKDNSLMYIVGVIVVGMIAFGLYTYMTGTSGSTGSATSLPPTDMAGHIESNPSSHVLTKQMDLRIQRHMLEHVDGEEGGRGGVIINYDCDNFVCEDGLIEDLESFADTYYYVYVAPFRNMPVKIALTKLNEIETLEEYDHTVIDSFING